MGLAENVNNCSQKNVTMSIKSKILNLNAGEKAIHYREKSMTEITNSQETLNVVNTALKHANPVTCDLCGELIKNIKRVNHQICDQRLCEQNVHILDLILMVINIPQIMLNYYYYLLIK
ncbi:hypothetical protein BpHYR1_047618 [Brachionus plicatilis]|uniref:Uncharacterized protein n=1 Tax=Brachionus plicatilis TaxID=10195 RepID=A0A3M7RTM1_BRAPC|nr:hypothetical protein BpHYR1_047618 [Brachionus plicatilis]